MVVATGKSEDRDGRRKPPSAGGVLTGDEIRNLGLISENFSPKCLRPTTYDLRLGNEFMVPRKGDGTSRFLMGTACLRIAKFSSVIVSTHELVRLPGNVTGKFNLKIKMALRGLFVQMGTQVEPNYHGRLFALLQNISDQEIVIEPQSENNKVFAIEFYYASRYVSLEASDFGEHKVDRIGQFVKGIAFSGTINNITTEMEQRLEKLEEANAGLRRDLTAASSRLEDVIPQINQATERLFSTKSLVLGAAVLSIIAIIVSVVAPVVAKIILDSTSQESGPGRDTKTVSSLPDHSRANSDRLPANEIAVAPIQGSKALQSLKTDDSRAAAASNEHKERPQ